MFAGYRGRGIFLRRCGRSWPINRHKVMDISQKPYRSCLDTAAHRCLALGARWRCCSKSGHAQRWQGDNPRKPHSPYQLARKTSYF